MKYSYMFALLAFLFIALVGLSPVVGQTVIKKHRVVTYQPQDSDAERTPRNVSDTEYREAFERLDAYLEKTLNIEAEEIVNYDFSDEAQVHLTFASDTNRPDTTLVIPDSVNFPKYLVADYGESKLKAANVKNLQVAGRRLQKAEKAMERAEAKRAITAERKARQAARKLKVEARYRDNEPKQYSVITISSDDSIKDANFVTFSTDDASTETIKTISRSDNNVEISVNGRSYIFQDGKPVLDTTQVDEESYQTVSSRKKARRLSQYDNDDDINISFNALKKKLDQVSVKKKFLGHWVGVELGFNWFLSPSGSFSLSGEQRPMRINMGSAINWNINFMQYSIPLRSEHIGLVVGLGTNFNHFRFKAKNTMSTGTDYIIFHTTLQDQGHNVKSSRFFSWSLTAPLLLEFQNRSTYWKRFYVATGAIAHLRLYSSTKVVYDKSREMSESDSFNMHDLSYAATLRIGYGPIRLYGNFYPMGFFESGQGPKVYPIELGIVILPFV